MPAGSDLRFQLDTRGEARLEMATCVPKDPQHGRINFEAIRPDAMYTSLCCFSGVSKSILLLAVLFMVSCASIPMQEAYVLSVEKRLQASQNWKVLAKQIAEEVELVIEKEKRIANGDHLSANIEIESKNLGVDPVFISDLDQSPFGRAMQTIIATEFIKHKVAMTRDPSTSFELDWLVQPVVHKADRKNSPSLLYIIFIGVPQAIFLGETDLGFQSKPHTEVIITFRLKRNGDDIFRQTHVYFINDEDVDHYWDISERGIVNHHSKTVLQALPVD
jgi:hypothetical protein